MSVPWKPTPAQLAAARHRTLPDVIAPGLRILFCGINPSLYSAAVGHHFARPGNRFWQTLYAAGLTPRLLSPFEDHKLLIGGMGLTNLVSRPTASAAELSEGDLSAGRRQLEDKVLLHGPDAVVFLGLSSYRVAFQRPHAVLGPQPDALGFSRVWLLPNPSGLNAHYQVPDLAKLFARLGPAIKPWEAPASEADALWALLCSQFTLGAESIHGPAHWRRVETFGLRIAETNGGDGEVVRLFAAFHDARRENDSVDPGHGRRGAELAAHLRRWFDLDDRRFELLRHACTHHTSGTTTDDPTVGACWDADRLDLPRAGIHPQVDYFSTQAAPGLVDWAARQSRREH